jgi:hypothetical protein
MLQALSEGDLRLVTGGGDPKPAAPPPKPLPRAAPPAPEPRPSTPPITWEAGVEVSVAADTDGKVAYAGMVLVSVKW